jgi:hypothetical protein
MNTHTSPVQRTIVAWASWFFEESAETDRFVHVKSFRVEAASFLDKQSRLL